MSNFTPQSTNEMVFHSDVERDLLLDILNHNIKFPSNGKNSLLLYGVVGSGKTTYANIFFSEYEHSFKDSSLLLDSMRVNDIEVDGNEKITTTVDKINTVANFVPLNELPSPIPLSGNLSKRGTLLQPYLCSISFWYSSSSHHLL